MMRYSAQSKSGKEGWWASRNRVQVRCLRLQKVRRASLALLLLTTPQRASGWGFCNDMDASCANWAKQGQCEVGDHVLELCPHSCSACPHTCRDVHTMCPAWADAGECKRNVKYMYKDCSASCGICKTRCYDKEVACSDWARKGECDRNQDLLTLCPVSCGVCTEMCLDKQNDCPLWAAAGECAKNPAYTLKECPNSCGVCGDHTHAMSTHPTRGEAERKLLTSRSACADVDKLQCLIWGEHECQTNPAAVMRDCPHTCGLCTLACEDKYSDCPNWAEGKANLFGNKSGKGCDEDKVSPEPHHASSPFASRQPRTLPQSWT